MAEPGPGARQLAELFHDRYERLAPQFGYETRKETRAFDPITPNGRLMIAVCDEILTWFDRQDAADLNAELERERMRLAGCGVAALADTPRTVAERLTRDSPYWSAAYGDVCRMVDQLMRLRDENEALRHSILNPVAVVVQPDETTPRLEDHENYCNEHGGHLRDSPACYLARERAR